MKNNYILIDYENVKPTSLALLNERVYKVMVFVGQNQTKVPFELAAALQGLGNKAEYIKISGTGPNALDFHIAFYVGHLAGADPEAYFHIISNDTGFDPLIAHLRNRKIHAQREKDLSEVTLLRVSNATTLDEKIDAVAKSLTSRGTSRPRKVKTLANTIHALFMKTLGEEELNAIIEQLTRRSMIVIENGNVSYKAPISP